MPADAASLVGRTAELGRLVGHVKRPDAALVVVLGEGGIGKTRLVDELVARAAPTHLVVRGRADEHETTPFGLWHGPSDQLELARPRADDTTPIAELRWDVVDGLTSGLSAAGSTLLVLEDIQWADDDSLWVLEHVTDRLAGAAVSVVATSRPATDARSLRWTKHVPTGRGDPAPGTRRHRGGRARAAHRG